MMQQLLYLKDKEVENFKDQMFKDNMYLFLTLAINLYNKTSKTNNCYINSYNNKLWALL